MAVPTGLRRLFTSLLPFLLVFIVVSLLSFYELWSEEVLQSVVSQRKKVAVLYAGPTFHDEVVAALACQLKDADYYTVLYVGSGVHMAGLMLPLSGRRKRGSLEFYGHCVDQWVTITDPLRRVVTDPDLLIFITYPMHIKGFVKDERAFDLLRHHKTTHASSSVVLVTHRVTEMLHALLPDIESLVSRDQLYFLFLGEHTVKSGLASMQRAGKPAIRVFAASPAGASNGSTPDTATAAAAAAASVLPYKLAHVFPIAPFHYIARLSPDSVPFSSYLAANSIDILVSAVSKLFSGEFTASSTSESEKRDRDTLVFGIQGNLGGKHAHRKNVEATVSCLRGIQEHLAPSSHLRLAQDLIGHISLPFVTGSLAKGSAIHFYNDLSSADYYNQISQLTFMVPAVADAGTFSFFIFLFLSSLSPPLCSLIASPLDCSPPHPCFSPNKPENPNQST